MKSVVHSESTFLQTVPIVITQLDFLILELSNRAPSEPVSEIEETYTNRLPNA